MGLRCALMTTNRAAIQLAPEHRPSRPRTQSEQVRAVMSDGQWRTFAQIRDECEARYARWHSETGISARIREFPHECRPVKPGSRQYQYRMRMGIVL